MPETTTTEIVGLLGSLSTFNHENSDFSVFLERLKQFFIANNITEEKRKKAILLNTLSEKCYILLRNLCVPNLPEDKPFEDLCNLLSEHLAPVKSLFAERLKFYTASRETSESVADWEAKIKKLASNCQFGDELGTVMRDIFVIGINDSKIMDRLFEEDASKSSVNLKQMVKLALSKESALKEHTVRQSWGAVNIKAEPVNFHCQRSQGQRYTQRSDPRVKQGSSSYTGGKHHGKIQAIKRLGVCVTSELSEVDVVSEKRQPKKKSYSSDSETESDLEIPQIRRPIRKGTNQSEKNACRESQVESVSNVMPVKNYESSTCLPEQLGNDDFSKNSENDPGESTISTDDNKFKKTCIGMLVKTNKMLRDLEEKLEEISRKVDNISIYIKEKPQSLEKNQEENEIIDIFTDFPIKNENMLNHIEKILISEAAYKNLVNILCRIGSKDFKECSRRFLKKILDDKFAAEYSLHGHKHKKIFKNTKICACVLDAIQRCHKNTTLKDIEVVVSAYLAKSTERLKRQQAAPVSEDIPVE
ncbi:uncharacterized protein [Leptinotarsa decemlineata]|uniref:uncharacterized protein n=1 Tax=Leptinotarsa decemlineata TaxID=7539 RepID=UPI003D309C2B